MFHTEQAESVFTMLKIAPNDIELDKTGDGRYWRLLHWLDTDVVLQLRIGHTSQDDPDDVIAEVKLVGSDDPGGRSEEGFTTLREFMYCAVELEDAEPDLDEFPDVCRDDDGDLLGAGPEGDGVRLGARNPEPCMT